MVERKNDITGKDSGEKIKCKICGREFKNYKSFSHHLKVHKITPKEYYDKFFKREDEGVCPVCGKETSFKNIREGYCKFCSYKCASIMHKGKHCSEETRKKISDANKGENNPNYGKHHSEETKKENI